jgi:hypothetical protein
MPKEVKAKIIGDFSLYYLKMNSTVNQKTTNPSMYRRATSADSWNSSMVEKTLRAKQAKTITNLSNKHDKKTDRQNKLTRCPLIEKKTDQMKMSPPPHKSTRNRRRTS